MVVVVVVFFLLYQLIKSYYDELLMAKQYCLHTILKINKLESRRKLSKAKRNLYTMIYGELIINNE